MNGAHVRVRAGGEDYSLPVDAVLEVAELDDLAPVPGSPPEILGVCNLRGQVMPVIDLAALLGVGGDAQAERIVVAEQGEARVGLAVEEVVDVGAIPPPTEAAESEFLTGASLVDGTLVGIVDLSGLLSVLTPEAAA